MFYLPRDSEIPGFLTGSFPLLCIRRHHLSILSLSPLPPLLHFLIPFNHHHVFKRLAATALRLIACIFPQGDGCWRYSGCDGAEFRPQACWGTMKP